MLLTLHYVNRWALAQGLGSPQGDSRSALVSKLLLENASPRSSASTPCTYFRILARVSGVDGHTVAIRGREAELPECAFPSRSLGTSG